MTDENCYMSPSKYIIASYSSFIVQAICQTWCWLLLSRAGNKHFHNHNVLEGSQRRPCPVPAGIIRAMKLGTTRLIFAQGRVNLKSNYNYWKELPQRKPLSQEWGREEVRNTSKDDATTKQTLSRAHSVSMYINVKYWEVIFDTPQLGFHWSGFQINDHDIS